MKGYKILVITSWSYSDALIQSHTLPYLKIIKEVAGDSEIFLSTQEADKNFMKYEVREKINLKLAPHGIRFKPLKYRTFGIIKLITSITQFFKLLWLIIDKKITHIHCFCTPAGGMGYILSVLTGRKLVLDSYEPHAESMVENGTWTKDGFAFKILWWLEKKQTQRADYHIAIASGMDAYAKKSYGLHLENILVKPSCVDLELFQYDERERNRIRSKLGWESKIICVYAGKFGGIYLESEVFLFLKMAHQFWGDAFRVLLLTSTSMEKVSNYCKDVELDDSIFYVTKAPFIEVAGYLSAADFGITPVKPVSSKRYCSPIKDGEYWAVGLPVVITANISDDSQIIEDENVGAVLKELNEEQYTAAVIQIDNLLKGNRKELRKKIRLLAEKYRNYNIIKKNYSMIYSQSEITKS